MQSSYFTAGLIINNGYVIDSAPIIKWSIGKTKTFIRRYCNKKKWRFIRIRNRRNQNAVQ